MAVFNPLNPLNNVTPRFTEEQLSEIIEFFEEKAKPLLVINDGEPIDVISIEQFIEFLELKKFHRRHFNYPTYMEIMSEAENLGAGVTRVLTKDQFIYILDKRVTEAEIKHELLLAFQIFDTEKRNFLELGDLEAIVTGYGDIFSRDETIEFLRDANVRGDGNIVYVNFIHSLFEMAPELNEIKPDFLYDDPDEDPSVPPLPPEPQATEAATGAMPLTPPPPPPLAKGGKKTKLA